MIDEQPALEAPAEAISTLPVPRRTRIPVLPARARAILTRAWPAAAILVLGYQHRWMSDDGLIYTRTVRQILAGHGPNINAGERAEACTSALWEWVLAGGAFVTRLDPAILAVFLGLLLTAAGFWIAADAAARLYGRGRTLLPAGALVLVALPPEWDFATSGLETGLVTAWLAGSWWLLLAVRRAPTRRQLGAAAFVAGLGPLVRPDLTIVSAALLAGIWALARPRRRTVVKLAALAGILPVGYEIFRAGYYGELVPLPALTKTAGTGHWSRGVAYLADYTSPYGLWVALVLAAVIADAALRTRRGRPARPDLIAAAVPVVAGVTGALYEVWIGGDFMHARMLLPETLLVLLPVMAVPSSRRGAVPVALLAAWSLLCGIALRVPYTGISDSGISNERLFYVDQAGIPHPDTGAEHAAGDPITNPVRSLMATGDRILVLPDGTEVPLRPDLPAGFALVWPALGINGVVVPLGNDSVDPMGLGYPLAAHLQISGDGRAGHDKVIPDVWIVADYGDPDAPTPKGIDPSQLTAARRALGCGALARLQASARAPMSVGMFFSNLWHAAGNTGLTFPADPVTAALEFCPTP